METRKVHGDVCGVGSKQRATRAIASVLEFMKWPMRLRLLRRREVLCPTWTGSLCVVTVLIALIVTCLTYAESFLSMTHRLQPDILVVEGWIGRKGLDAAVDEFERGGYRYIVASGGLTSGLWGEDEPTSYAEMAGGEMIRLGVPKERVIVATAENTESHRTFESAVAVWRALQSAGISPKRLNVFTVGPHARRSGLVFSKVNSQGPKVGVLGWIPPEYKTEPWWRSSDRSRELMEETAGYLYEVLLNSGRRSNSPVAGGSSDFVQRPN
jgi:hypothetical protein